MPNLLDDNSLEQSMRAAKEYADDKINSLNDIAILIKGEKGDVGAQGPQGEPGSYTETGSKSMPIYIDKDGTAKPIASGHVYSLGIGYGALSKNSELYNTAFGYKSLLENTIGYRNAAFGSDSLQQNVTGNYNAAIGHATLLHNQSGNYNTAVGGSALYLNELGSYNVALGGGAAYNTKNTGNVAVGHESLRANVNGTYNVALGFNSLKNIVNASWNTAVGSYTMTSSVDYHSCTGLGHRAEVTGDYQIQLGWSSNTTYCYGAVQNRSDERDKANITDLDYNYRDFITGLKVRSFQWDYRDDYRDTSDVDNPDMRKLAEITHDGTHIRSRRHGGFIAQEVKVLADSLGFDFSGYQDHSINGGDDVLSLGYEAFIPPLVATVQDQDKEIKDLRTMITTLINKNEELEARIIQLERR